MQTGKRSVADIFNQGRTLEIPFYQRSYVWAEENWERFLDDIEAVSEESKSYFMGSIILKTRPVSSGEDIGDVRNVIDGQQRLTTIVLFFKILCEMQTDGDQLFERIFYNRRKEIILKHNLLDVEVFEAIVNGKVSEAIRKKYKNNSVLECWKFFEKRKEIIKNLNFDRIFDRLYFLGIDLDADEDEQQIFDTINSLGVSLTTAELLKNELFNREDYTLYQKTWKSVFEKDEDVKSYWDLEITSGRQHRVNIDLFLQSYLLIRSDAHDKYLGLSSLFENYKTFLKDHDDEIGKKDFIEELVKYALLYQGNVDPELLDQEIDQKSHIDRLNIVVFGLNTTTVIPYMLYVLNEVKTEGERENIFRILESYLMRRLVCRETTKAYNNLFASFIRNKISSFEALKDKIENFNDPTNRFPGDKVFLESFQENILTNQQAKTVLYLMEKSIQDSKDSTIIRVFNEYSVEHVMPKKWVNNWKNLENRSADERDEFLLKLGNLTILTASLNSSIRDADWKVKRLGKGGKKGLEDYSAGIKTFQPYLKEDDWNEELIEKRGKWLSERALEIWKM